MKKAFVTLLVSLIAVGESVAAADNVATSGNLAAKVICAQPLFDLTAKGDTLRMPAEVTAPGNATVYLKVDPKWTEIQQPVENQRETRLSEDLKDLTNVLFLLGGINSLGVQPGAGVPQPKDCIEYIQTQERASVEINYKDGGKGATKTVITGPEEHKDITLDVPVTSVKQLKYDSTSKQIVTNNQAGKPFIGASYRFGDIFTTYGWDKFYKDLSAKIMVRPPLGGAKWAAGGGGSVDFPWCSVFVAVVRARGDGQGVPSKTSIIWGISLPLVKYAKLGQSAANTASKAANQ